MKIFFSVLLWVTVLSCNSEKKEKPTTIPKNAVWKGGVDGGCWILFGSITKSSVEATIFDESGEIWDKGIFIKQGNCSIPNDSLIEKIVGFDGQSLITNEKCSFKK